MADRGWQFSQPVFGLSLPAMNRQPPPPPAVSAPPSAGAAGAGFTKSAAARPPQQPAPVGRPADAPARRGSVSVGPVRQRSAIFCEVARRAGIKPVRDVGRQRRRAVRSRPSITALPPGFQGTGGIAVPAVPAAARRQAADRHGRCHRRHGRVHNCWQPRGRFARPGRSGSQDSAGWAPPSARKANKAAGRQAARTTAARRAKPRPTWSRRRRSHGRPGWAAASPSFSTCPDPWWGAGRPVSASWAMP